VRKRVAVIGGSYVDGIRAGGRVDVVDIDRAGRDELSGADVVVLEGEGDGPLHELVRDRAPSAIVLVVGASPQPVCEATLFPRGRIIGVEADPALVSRVIDSIVFDRGEEFETVVRCQGERGIDDEFARVPVRVAASGVVEILERDRS
jgi:hypothetical protein